ncbi:MAG: 7,8-didemethyl-8-hydroxy-5-deazariboflavin synthase subunit CofH [Lysobacterales bacterium]|nr:MAG: 7,8-didemethyl-8-hydroxy-5-deazariboflavin synthase subunit CofH [Xanthomonadales bacterium]
MSGFNGIVSGALSSALGGARLQPEDALALASCDDLGLLSAAAGRLRDQAHGPRVSYSPKVFIPLTQLCRDVCHYCTFAQTPKKLEAPYLVPEQVLAIARAGAAAGCHEALFTLGDKPELRYATARKALAALGHDSTLSYLEEMARLVFAETGLLPHLNAGVMGREELLQLRAVSASQGLMLESVSLRLLEPGQPHHGSPDKQPAARLATIAAAGQAAIPFTTGILIGIGETRRERIESLLALRELHDAHGHLQEYIIQNFRRKPGTRMAAAPEPSLDELAWTVAVARLVLGPEANIQAPPNLSPDGLGALLRAGINDWGGVSPVTRDHVNPEAPWPEVARLAAATAQEGKLLLPRLPVYPAYALQSERWLDPALRAPVLRRIDATGYPREDDWSPGAQTAVPELSLRPASAAEPRSGPRVGPRVGPHVDVGPACQAASRAANGLRLSEAEIVSLFEARGREQEMVCAAADELRAAVVGDTVTYIVTRNINYTNICGFKCGFCAFSKGRGPRELREAAYDLPLAEIQARAREARQRGAVEVCLQGGIHPRYDGNTYVGICRAIKAVEPGLHIHAFSPLEIWQGARTLGVSLADMLRELKAAGLSSLPGTAAEILDDEVRREICPDKLTTEQWLEVVRTAHAVGLTTTATIMFGHVDHPRHWARHLLRIRDLQQDSGGFTELVPLPFVHMGAPIYRDGRARRGPTFRESLLMHAAARLVLHPHIRNIQASWTKLGRQGALMALRAGANDLGGTLMNESISRAAGAAHGQELLPAEMEALIRSIGRAPAQRTNCYRPVWGEAAARAN